MDTSSYLLTFSRLLRELLFVPIVFANYKVSPAVNNCRCQCYFKCMLCTGRTTHGAKWYRNLFLDIPVVRQLYLFQSSMSQVASYCSFGGVSSLFFNCLEHVCGTCALVLILVPPSLRCFWCGPSRLERGFAGLSS